MLSFYPGPSKVYEKSLDFIKEAYDLGIPSINHRSNQFMNLYQEIQELIQEKWSLPKGYSIAFTSSATESWEIFIQQNLSGNKINFHTGAFGEKWGNYLLSQFPNAQNLPWENNSTQWKNLNSEDMVSIVHSETSNGSMVLPNRNLFGKAIIGVDANSSMGGMLLPWEEADFWLASSQKCLGMPAGLGIILYNERLINHSAKQKYYNDLTWIDKNRQKNQTQHTPNVLMIYVFKRLLESLPSLQLIHQNTAEKAELIENFAKNRFEYLIPKKEERLPTVHAFAYEPKILIEFLKKIEEEKIVLGKGYGKYQESSFRIANFPAHTKEDLEQLFHTMEKIG